MALYQSLPISFAFAQKDASFMRASAKVENMSPMPAASQAASVW